MAKQPGEEIPVKIRIKTTVSNENGRETFELATFGRYCIKGRTRYLLYEEVLDVGKVRSVVKITADEIVILRRGPVEMNMKFQRNKELAGRYKTPYGILDIATCTKELAHSCGEEERKGSVRIQYDLKMQGALAGTYDLQLQFEEERQK